MEDAFVGAFERRPEGLDAVRVGLAVDVLGDRVTYRVPSIYSSARTNSINLRSAGTMSA